MKKKRKEIDHSVRNRTARRKMEEYFVQCDREGKKYTYPGLQVALGISEETLEDWCKDRKLRRDVELARAKIRDALEQREDQMALYLRRQEKKNAGEETEGTLVYFEKPEDVKDYGA